MCKSKICQSHTCWYAGAGKRVALDRDEDGVFNYFEAD